jgi:hypothetical protein
VTTANLMLRFGAARVRALVRWPRAGDIGDEPRRPLALVLADEMTWVGELLGDCVVVTLCEPHRYPDELGALQWLSEHAADIGAVGGRVVIAGGARAARLAVAARDGGWPQLHRQLLIHPRFSAEDPMPVELAGLAPATVVCSRFGDDDGPRYVALLRAAGIDVTEVRS